METTLNCKVLVAEEVRLVGFEISERLKRSGFKIIEKAGKEDLLHLMRTQTPDFTIATVRSLVNLLPAEDFYKRWRSKTQWYGNTDTIIFDKSMCPLTSYSKPFDSNEIINFINNLISKTSDYENHD